MEMKTPGQHQILVIELHFESIRKTNYVIIFFPRDGAVAAIKPLCFLLRETLSLSVSWGHWKARLEEGYAA